MEVNRYGAEMEAVGKVKWRRRSAFTVAVVGLLASLLALYAKLYFWGGTRYAPFYVEAGIWFVIVAGPLALWLSRTRPFASLAIVALQLGLIWLASIY